MTAVVEIAKQPIEERAAALQQLQSAMTKDTSVRNLGLLFLPVLDKMHDADLRTKAQLRCFILALAAERYRLQNGTWPARPEALVEAKLLTAVPLDPYDGKPVRMRRFDDRLVVYTVWEDRTDNGGVSVRYTNEKSGTDLGFTLWYVDRRRQPPVELLTYPQEVVPELPGAGPDMKDQP
jgi:hypothetical protein